MAASNGPDTEPGAGPLQGVSAVVVTYRRPRLAGDVVRALIDVEGFDPAHVIVVVNAEGGLDDEELEGRVTMLRLPENTGPAGGFGAGLRQAFADPSVQWAYLCEDDVGLFDLPAPRVAVVLAHAASPPPSGDDPIGAVVSYGRRFTAHGGHTVNTVPPTDALTPVDVACWGATLLSRAVVDAGVLPDPEWFFGYEDFDFFCRLRAAGFSIMVDPVSARAVADQQTSRGRAVALAPHRPVGADEAWRGYYVARNYFAFAHRHGSPSWYLWHLAYSVRRLQLARTAAERTAYLHGLWDGMRGRLGVNPRYLSRRGELPVPGQDRR